MQEDEMDRVDIAIVGGGLAAAATAESYRASGGTGSVTIFTDEPDLPAHRPPLSKEFLRGDDDLDRVYVHPADFYREKKIGVRLNSRVDRIRVEDTQLVLDEGERVSWDKLVLATGARSRTLKLPGSELPGLHYLRSVRSAQALRAAYAGAESAVIIGAGFIGMEVAATLTQKGVSCTVIEMASRIWPALVPEATASFMQRYFESKGVQFLFNTGVEALEGDGRVESVALSHGRSVRADLVVAGVGAALNVELAENAGLQVDRGVVVDSMFRSSHPAVYAVGDIANFPDPIGGSLHLEHWDNALAQGRALGQILAGRPHPFEHVAYFFSDLFDLSLNMVGYPVGWDDVDVRGDMEDGSFTTVYIKEGRTRAALMVNDDDQLDYWTTAVASYAPIESVRPPRRELAGVQS
jgi:3-phenylpropionate/trans-cinnamate dioxygenase ferredoxin reductase subunit